MDAAFNIENNVTIKVVERNKVVRTIKVHNKANSKMVQGLLRFLSGDFTPLSTNPNVGTVSFEEISSYVPISMHFGNIGVQMENRSTSEPKFIGINSEQQTIPSFEDYALQQDISYKFKTITNYDINFDTISITDYDSTNNSMGLLLTVNIAAGELVGIGQGDTRKYFIDSDPVIGTGNGWVYWNSSKSRYEAMFTELGLFSDTGDLLARVLLNGEVSDHDSSGDPTYKDPNSDVNPLIQTDNTSLIIEWRIGIASLGQNDNVISITNTDPTRTTPPPTDFTNTLLSKQLYKDYVNGKLDVLEVPKAPKGSESERVSVRSYCFYGQSEATAIILPKGVIVGSSVDIGSSAFSGCTAVTDAFLEGSESDWSSCLSSLMEVLPSTVDLSHIHYNYVYYEDYDIQTNDSNQEVE